MDETLEAEQSAARSATRRRRSLRDLFLDLEDRADPALVWADDGHCYRGTVCAVGIDHAELQTDDGSRVVVFAHVVALETGR